MGTNGDNMDDSPASALEDGLDDLDTLDDPTSAGTENTEGSAGQGAAAGAANTDGELGRLDRHPRFQQIIRQNRELRERLAALEARGTGEAAGGANGAGAAGQAPPANASAAEKLGWYVRQALQELGPGFVQQALTQQLGADPGTIKTMLTGLSQDVRVRTVQEYEGACTQMGLDPKNVELRKVVAGYMRTSNEHSPTRALAAVLKVAGAGHGPSRRQGTADMLESGMAGVTVVDDAQPKSFDEARSLAQQGKMVRHRSVTDILAAARKQA